MRRMVRLASKNKVTLPGLWLRRKAETQCFTEMDVVFSLYLTLRKVSSFVDERCYIIPNSIHIR